MLTPLHEHSDEIKQRGLSRLATLLEHADPVELFVATASSIMFVTAENLAQLNSGIGSVKIERLAYELYPHFGRPHAPSETVLVESTSLRPGDIQICHEILDDLVFSYAFQAFTPTEAEDDHLIASIRGRKIIVRGNAYPEQTERRIREIQGRFDHWYTQHVGIAPTRAVEALRAIVSEKERVFVGTVRPIAAQAADLFESKWQAIREKRRRNAEESTFIEQFPTRKAAHKAGLAWVSGGASFLHIPAGRPALEPALTNEEWNTLLSLIGLTGQEREKMQDPVEVRNRPLYVLPDGRVLFVNLSNVWDALWEAFDLAARQDQAFYDAAYQTYASDWLVKRVVIYLNRLFPNGAVYRTLDYPDPERAPSATAELDAAVVWEPFVLLIEAKARQFRVAGQLGDVGRLRTDLKRNIEEAFHQALRARKYIESASRPTFRERGTGRELVLNKTRLRRLYPLTVSLHHLATLTTRLAALAPLGLFKENEYPFAISEADLEIVAELCPGPDVFLHYVEKRIALHRVSPHVSGDDVDLLGAYLDTRFVSKQLWDNPKNRASMFGLDGYSDKIDRWALHQWTGIGERPEIRLALPEGIRDILSHLRSLPDDNMRWIAFCLLDMAFPALKACADGLNKARSDPPKRGGFRRFVAAGDDVVICVVASHGHSTQALAANLEKRVTIERYRRRAQKAIGFGLAVEDTNPFTVVAWEDRDWEPNPELGRLIENDAPGIPLPGTKVPGRNDPCLCGSRRKYKKCCLPRIEEARRRQN